VGTPCSGERNIGLPPRATRHVYRRHAHEPSLAAWRTSVPRAVEAEHTKVDRPGNQATRASSACADGDAPIEQPGSTRRRSTPCERPTRPSVSRSTNGRGHSRTPRACDSGGSARLSGARAPACVQRSAARNFALCVSERACACGAAGLVDAHMHTSSATAAPPLRGWRHFLCSTCHATQRRKEVAPSAVKARRAPRRHAQDCPRAPTASPGAARLRHTPAQCTDGRDRRKFSE
jgi:hypothetical protein